VAGGALVVSGGGRGQRSPWAARRRTPVPDGRSSAVVSSGVALGAGETTSLEHRRFLPAPASWRPFRGGALFARVGGTTTVALLVDTLYDGLTTDPRLRPLFDGDRTAERARQKCFFGEWLGGPPAYSGMAWAGLAHRHAELPITRARAGLWLGHFRRALEASVAAADDRAAIFERAQELAFGLVNDGPDPERGTPHGMCLPRHHPVNVACDLAHRGDASGLAALQGRVPDLLDRPLHAAAILHRAALAGRVEAVTWLLDRAVDVDRPCSLPVGVAGLAFEGILFVTPLCAALLRRRGPIAALLRERGAKADVFTAAFLGDQPALGRLLASDRTLAQAADPATDVVEVTALHHAVSGGNERAIAAVLDHIDLPLRGAERALRGAAARGARAVVTRLLTMGADARAVGVGRWVLDPEIAPLLAAGGATVGGSGHWIGASCTGNQGRKDDPDFVRALLRHGARADDRRPGSNATALHHAARAGFLRTIALLLEHGADPDARDAGGATPLDWLEQATKSVNRAAVRALLAGRPSRD
jgi:truncated hemoglobin YjbI/ankyrin repeat protein